MKSNRKYIEITATLLLTTLFSASAIPISEAATKPKSAGRTSNAIPNTILNGKGAPLSTLGINGDFYIDTRSLLIYGPKKSNKWPLPQSLQGPVGAAGADGKNGSEGKTISNTSTLAGPTGAQGEKGEKGDKGESGPAGANGAPGAAGLTGAKGETGATGPSGGGGGTPGATGATGATGSQGPIGLTGLTGAKGETGTAGSSGANGAVGATGAKGDTGTAGSSGAVGAVGAVGATGAKGETGTAGSTGANGAVGATGPSNVYVNSIPSWNLSTSSAGTYSTSTFFLNFKSGKHYLYTIYLVGQSDATGGVFALEMIHSDGSTSSFGYSVVQNSNFSSEPKFIRYTFTITGVISPSGGDVGVAIRIIDDLGITGSPNAMTFSGIAFSTLVGAVGAL